ncbi:MAG: hypothetical protein NTY48_07265 [Candidatus Diapherotrites archaeon]|nr:hypothetical protein [Candidatus Diapherotrites archaeon]
MSKDTEIKLYRFLLEKYADLINEREKHTIGEIKALVNGTDLTILSFVSDFKDSAYSFSDDYEKSLRLVFDFAKKEIDFVDAELNLNYWLAPRELLEVKVADDEDLAVFLCANMTALGDERAEVIIAELDNLKTHAFVATELNGSFLILDPAQDHKFEDFKGTKTLVLGNYSFNSQKIRRFLYRFNSQKYEQFLE